MIVRMKKLLLFTSAAKADETVVKLGKLGVVEIKEIVHPDGEQLQTRKEQLERSNTAISILEKSTDDQLVPSQNQYSENDPKRLIDRVLIAVDFRQNAEKKWAELQNLMDWYKVWGKDLQPDDIQYLRKQGIFVRLYLIPKAQLPEITKKHTVQFFQEKDGKIPTALFSERESEHLHFEEVQIPPLSQSQIRKQLNRKKRQLIEVAKFLKDQKKHINLLNEYRQFLDNQMKVLRTTQGMGKVGETVKYLLGFLPVDQIEEFKSVAKNEHWGYQVSDPERDEEVPVCLRNPGWIKIINPVMRFIDIVPGYREIDVSVFFLIAFALFFAMLVGDAGYGLLFLLITWLVRKRISVELRWLAYVLSGGTIIWGIFSGTYFGSAEIAGLPVVQSLTIDKLSSFNGDNINFMMHLSFIIGAIHLTLAHLIKGIQFINSIKVLSEIGWIALIWGLFMLAEQLVLGVTMPDWSYWLFIAGVLSVALFSAAGNGFFKSIIISLSKLPLSLINAFSDIVSYVRLFAVGLATVTVAASFNQMILAGGISNLGPIQFITAAVALLLGHGLNIALALMAVMVHGLRLNMLEFAGHVGVQFSGKAFEPFKLYNFKEEAQRP